MCTSWNLWLYRSTFFEVSLLQALWVLSHHVFYPQVEVINLLDNEQSNLVSKLTDLIKYYIILFDNKHNLFNSGQSWELIITLFPYYT